MGIIYGGLPYFKIAFYTLLMRSLLFLLICRLLICRSLAAQQSGVEGIAIDALTRRPLAGVHITMRPFVSEGAPSDQAWGATSTREGRFSITSMPPAIYILTTRRNGYVQPPSNDEAITLKPGEQLTTLIVALTPEAIISGRVLDENGDPVQWVRVQAIPTGNAHNSELPMGRIEHPDERGRFRMTGPPGKYYIKASPEHGIESEREIRSDGLSPPLYGITYYPSAEKEEQANLVDATAGHEVAGVEIRLARHLNLTISGVVTGAPAGRSQNTVVFLTATNQGNEQFEGRRVTLASSDGRFAAPNLGPGHYLVSAYAQSESGPLRSRFAEVQLDNADHSGLTLALIPGETLTGVIKIEGDSAKTASPEKMAIRLEPAEDGHTFGAEQPQPGNVSPDGSFQIDQVFPQKLRLRVLSLPENAYVKSVKLDDAEVRNSELDFSQGVNGARIKVTVSRNGGQLSGKVLAEDGSPLRSSLAFVCLAETPSDLTRSRLKPVENGAKFTYTGLRPGKYRLIAIDSGQPGDWQTAMEALFPKAPEIEIREADRIEKDVKVMTTEATSAKP
jgi:hypothetical protein